MRSRNPSLHLKPAATGTFPVSRPTDMRIRPLEPEYRLRRSPWESARGRHPVSSYVRRPECESGPSRASLPSGHDIPLRPTGTPGHNPRSGFPLPRIVSETRPTMSCRSETPCDRHAGAATCTPSTNRTSFHHMIFDRGALCLRGRIVGGGLCSSRRTLDACAGGPGSLWSLP